MKHSFFFPALLLCWSCTTTKKSPVTNTIIDKTEDIKAAAWTYLWQQTGDEATMSKIRFDTVYKTTPAMVTFRVNNDSLLTARNMYVVYVNNDFSIDSQYIRAKPEQIQQHIHHPSQYPLLLSKDGAVSIARSLGLEKGIKPWKIRLNLPNRKLENAKWSVSNTIRESVSGAYSASGEILVIDAMKQTVEKTKWRAIE